MKLSIGRLWLASQTSDYSIERTSSGKLRWAAVADLVKRLKQSLFSTQS